MIFSLQVNKLIKTTELKRQIRSIIVKHSTLIPAKLRKLDTVEILLWEYNLRETRKN